MAISINTVRAGADYDTIAAKITEITTKYRQNIFSHDATAYENSLICQTDGVLLKRLDNLKSAIDTEFTPSLNAIVNKCPSNYENTTAYLESISSSVNAGIGSIDGYQADIKSKSEEAFKEYKTEFGTLNTSYLAQLRSIKSDQTKRTTLLSQLTPLDQITDGSKGESDNQDILNKVDSIVKKLVSKVNTLRKYVIDMDKLLDKGLKKV